MHWLSWSKMCRAKDSGGMGFWDLECFNLAMLAKQAWRLVTDPDSLLSRILKARYYPRGTYFTADVGERPSHTWRGILAARNGLSQGLRKRIGNGLDTAIWGDFWVPPRSSSRIMTRRPPDCVFPDKVSDLIDWSTWSWDFELISNTFWEVDVHNILQLSFGSPTTEDKLFWAFSKTGHFTVRSCYHNLLNGKIGMDSPGGSASEDNSRWKWLWKINVPPKVRTFLWRASHEIIPTRAALASRHVGTNPFCDFCNEEIETGAHLFFTCPFFAAIWTENPFGITHPFPASNFAMGLRSLRDLVHE